MVGLVHAIVIADGDVPDREGLESSWPGWNDGATLVIAADGGAKGASALGLAPDLVVGDGDSLGESGLARLAAAGIAIERAPVDKDESDTELAVRAALSRGAQRITIVGAFGGPRFDHALANVGLLALPDLRDRPVVLLDERTRVTLLRGPSERAFPGRPGDVISLLPVGDGVEGVTTAGLAFPLSDEPLPAGPARGLSNVRQGKEARVTVRRGLLLVIESPATLAS